MAKSQKTFRTPENSLLDERIAQSAFADRALRSVAEERSSKSHPAGTHISLVRVRTDWWRSTKFDGRENLEMGGKTGRLALHSPSADYLRRRSQQVSCGAFIMGTNI
jgi:hypothetical protein